MCLYKIDCRVTLSIIIKDLTKLILKTIIIIILFLLYNDAIVGAVLAPDHNTVGQPQGFPLQNNLFSQAKNNSVPTDSGTTKEVKLPPIEIIETRSKSNSAINFSPNKIVAQQEIQIASPLQLSEVLNFSPGINIRNYGGLGAMKTVSIRGSGSMRSLILLDGMPLNSSQNGSFDLNNIAVSMIDNIEVIRGGASAIFGGNAIGGAINIRTNSLDDKVLALNLGYGSFNELTVNFAKNMIMESKYVERQNSFITNYLSVNVDFQRSDGDFPFTFNQFGKDEAFKRENSDYTNFGGTISGKIYFSDWSIWGRGIFSTVDKGVPGAILQGTVNQSNARWEEGNYTLLLNANRFFSEKSELTISGVFRNSKTLFKEFSMATLPEHNFLLNDFGLTARYNFTTLGLFNEIVGSGNYSTLSGDMLDKNLDGFVDRISFALGYRVENNLQFSNQILSLNAGARMDNNIENSSDDSSNYKTTFSGTVGGIYAIKNFPIKFRGNISHNFRFPNFNEMYYRFYGTENLLPEKSNNFNLGFFFDLFNLFDVNVDGFHIDTRDMIISVPTSPMTWQAMNLAKTVSNGLEFSLSLLNEIKFIHSFNFNYTLQKTLDKSANSITFNKQLSYIPQEIFNYFLTVRLGKFILGTRGEYSSYRYLQDDNSPNAILPQYFVNDIFVERRFTVSNYSLKIRFECKNIFDERYEIISNYIMPGRQFRGTIGIEL